MILPLRSEVAFAVEASLRFAKPGLSVCLQADADRAAKRYRALFPVTATAERPGRSTDRHATMAVGRMAGWAGNLIFHSGPPTPDAPKTGTLRTVALPSMPGQEERAPDNGAGLSSTRQVTGTPSLVGGEWPRCAESSFVGRSGPCRISTRAQVRAGLRLVPVLGLAPVSGSWFLPLVDWADAS